MFSLLIQLTLDQCGGGGGGWGRPYVDILASKYLPDSCQIFGAGFGLAPNVCMRMMKDAKKESILQFRKAITISLKRGVRRTYSSVEQWGTQSRTKVFY